MKRKLHFIDLIPILLFFTSVLFFTNSYDKIPLLELDTNPIVNGSNQFGPSPFTPTTVTTNVTCEPFTRNAGVSIPQSGLSTLGFTIKKNIATTAGTNANLVITSFKWF